MQFDNFHGGSDERYMPMEDQYVFFDDIKVTEGLCVASTATNSTGATAEAAVTATNITLLEQQALNTSDPQTSAVERRVELAGPGEDAFLSLADVSTVCGANGSNAATVAVPAAPGPAPTRAPTPALAASSASSHRLSVFRLCACFLLALLV